MKKCLACYESLKRGSTQEYHEKCSRKIFGTPQAPILDYNFNQINELAKENIKNRLAVPGVQPKLSLTIEPSKVKNDTNARLTIVGLWNGLFVLKPPNKKFPEIPENEDLTMHLAALCGIDTANHCLIRFKSGELAYLAKRFDRKLNKRKRTVEKLHQEDFCQLTGLLTENKYNSSMEKVAKAVATYTTNRGLEAVTLFQLTVFSFLTGNSDMHLKNFSILKDEDGTIRLTPAYDLLATKLVTIEDREDMALTIGGKKSKLKRDDFLKFAEFCQIAPKAAENVLNNLEKNLSQISVWVQKSFLSKDMKEEYLNLIRTRADRLDFEVPESFTE